MYCFDKLVGEVVRDMMLVRGSIFAELPDTLLDVAALKVAVAASVGLVALL